MDFTLGLLGSLAITAGTSGWPFNLGQGYKNECSREIVVGVIDTGLNDQLKTVKRSVKTNTLEMLDGLDNDHNGLVDDVAGWDFGYNDRRPEDTNGHGTHVAQILLGNSSPTLDFNLKCRPQIRIVPIKYHNAKWANVEDSTQAFLYALKYPGMSLINYSSGGLSPSPYELDAFKKLKEAGIVVVVAAGNDSTNLVDRPYYPAAYGFENVVAVANCVTGARLHPSSNYGGAVKFCAPGTEIKAVLRGKRAEALTGTSQAVPQITRALAVLMSQNPRISAKEAVNKLCVAADPIFGATCGHVNLPKAMKK